MADYVQHLIMYSTDELRSLLKNEEVFRIFPKNPNRFYYNLRPLLDTDDVKKLNIEVSNLGTVKINGTVVKPFEKNKGWLYIKICDKIPEYPLYRLVAETWCEFLGEDTVGWEAHHISNDGYDNRPENVIWIKKEEHQQVHKWTD
ncbi:MAG: HNH endonuclease [Treponematales bacterium]